MAHSPVPTPVAPAFPTPDVNELTRPYWDGLKENRLMFQKCRCGNAWLPARRECPNCLGTEWQWTQASGKGCLISWVVYHTSYHDAFKSRLPYNVAVVELDEGPRLITNMVDANESLRGDAQVTLQVGWEGETALARFRMTD